MKLPWSKPAPEPEAVTPAPAIIVNPVRSAGEKKGKATPKRRDVQPRRSGPVAAPPMTGKEARARQKERNRELKAKGIAPERRVSSAAAEDRIAARDAGPERTLVRNIVDSRRSIGSSFIIIAPVILVVTFLGVGDTNPQLYNQLSLAWLIFFVVIVIEAIYVGRKVMKRIRADFPKSTERPLSLKFYAFTRGLMIRKWRYPKPVVKVGDKV